MVRFVFGAAALVLLASSPAAAERPWGPGGYTGDRRCAGMLQWASLEPSRSAAERASLRSVMLVACSPGGAAPLRPPAPKASPPPTRFIQVRWSVRKAAGTRGKGHAMARKSSAGTASGAISAWIGADPR
jgi:hypothetical protein